MDIMNKIREWCASNTAAAKCTRTIFQGIVGVLITFAPDLVAGAEVVPNEYKPMIVAAVMAILSPIQASLGGTDGGEE